jgi:hypothetical protein
MVTDALFTTGVNPVLLVRPTNPNYQIAATRAARPRTRGASGADRQPWPSPARVDFDARAEDVDGAAPAWRVRGNFMKQDFELRRSPTGKVSATTTGYFSQTGPQTSSTTRRAITTVVVDAVGRVQQRTGGVGRHLHRLDPRSREQNNEVVGKLLETARAARQSAAIRGGPAVANEDMVLNPSAALGTGDIADRRRVAAGQSAADQFRLRRAERTARGRRNQPCGAHRRLRRRGQSQHVQGIAALAADAPGLLRGSVGTVSARRR